MEKAYREIVEAVKSRTAKKGRLPGLQLPGFYKPGEVKVGGNAEYPPGSVDFSPNTGITTNTSFQPGHTRLYPKEAMALLKLLHKKIKDPASTARQIYGYARTSDAVYQQEINDSFAETAGLSEVVPIEAGKNLGFQFKGKNAAPPGNNPGGDNRDDSVYTNSASTRTEDSVLQHQGNDNQLDVPYYDDDGDDAPPDDARAGYQADQYYREPDEEDEEGAFAFENRDRDVQEDEQEDADETLPGAVISRSSQAANNPTQNQDATAPHEETLRRTGRREERTRPEPSALSREDLATTQRGPSSTNQTQSHTLATSQAPIADTQPAAVDPYKEADNRAYDEASEYYVRTRNKDWLQRYFALQEKYINEVNAERARQHAPEPRTTPRAASTPQRSSSSAPSTAPSTTVSGQYNPPTTPARGSVGFEDDDIPDTSTRGLRRTFRRTPRPREAPPDFDDSEIMDEREDIFSTPPNTVRREAPRSIRRAADDTTIDARRYIPPPDDDVTAVNQGLSGKPSNVPQRQLVDADRITGESDTDPLNSTVDPLAGLSQFGTAGNINDISEIEGLGDTEDDVATEPKSTTKSLPALGATTIARPRTSGISNASPANTTVEQSNQSVRSDDVSQLPQDISHVDGSTSDLDQLKKVYERTLKKNHKLYRESYLLYKDRGNRGDEAKQRKVLEKYRETQAAVTREYETLAREIQRDKRVTRSQANNPDAAKPAPLQLRPTDQSLNTVEQSLLREPAPPRRGKKNALVPGLSSVASSATSSRGNTPSVQSSTSNNTTATSSLSMAQSYAAPGPSHPGSPLATSTALPTPRNSPPGQNIQQAETFSPPRAAGDERFTQVDLQAHDRLTQDEVIADPGPVSNYQLSTLAHPPDSPPQPSIPASDPDSNATVDSRSSLGSSVAQNVKDEYNAPFPGGEDLRPKIDNNSQSTSPPRRNLPVVRGGVINREPSGHLTKTVETLNDSIGEDAPLDPEVINQARTGVFNDQTAGLLPFYYGSIASRIQDKYLATLNGRDDPANLGALGLLHQELLSWKDLPPKEQLKELKQFFSTENIQSNPEIARAFVAFLEEFDTQAQYHIEQYPGAYQRDKGGPRYQEEPHGVSQFDYRVHVGDSDFSENSSVSQTSDRRGTRKVTNPDRRDLINSSTIGPPPTGEISEPFSTQISAVLETPNRRAVGDKYATAREGQLIAAAAPELARGREFVERSEDPEYLANLLSTDEVVKRGYNQLRHGRTPGRENEHIRLLMRIAKEQKRDLTPDDVEEYTRYVPPVAGSRPEESADRLREVAKRERRRKETGENVRLQDLKDAHEYEQNARDVQRVVKNINAAAIDEGGPDAEYEDVPGLQDHQAPQTVPLLKAKLNSEVLKDEIIEDVFRGKRHQINQFGKRFADLVEEHLTIPNRNIQAKDFKGVLNDLPGSRQQYEHLARHIADLNQKGKEVLRNDGTQTAYEDALDYVTERAYEALKAQGKTSANQYGLDPKDYLLYKKFTTASANRSDDPYSAIIAIFRQGGDKAASLSKVIEAKYGERPEIPRTDTAHAYAADILKSYESYQRRLQAQRDSILNPRPLPPRQVLNISTPEKVKYATLLRSAAQETGNPGFDSLVERLSQPTEEGNALARTIQVLLGNPTTPAKVKKLQEPEMAAAFLKSVERLYPRTLQGDQARQREAVFTRQKQKALTALPAPRDLNTSGLDSRVPLSPRQNETVGDLASFVASVQAEAKKPLVQATDAVRQALTDYHKETDKGTNPTFDRSRSVKSNAGVEKFARHLDAQLAPFSKSVPSPQHNIPRLGAFQQFIQEGNIYGPHTPLPGNLLLLLEPIRNELQTQYRKATTQSARQNLREAHSALNDVLETPHITYNQAATKLKFINAGVLARRLLAEEASSRPVSPAPSTQGQLSQVLQAQDREAAEDPDFEPKRPKLRSPVLGSPPPVRARRYRVSPTQPNTQEVSPSSRKASEAGDEAGSTASSSSTIRAKRKKTS